MTENNQVLAYKKLDPRSHVLLRHGMYIGSIDNVTTECYVEQDNKMVKRELTYNPGLLKMFDEIISNSVDAHIKHKTVTAIHVNVFPLTGEIQVEDDGGIPVLQHPEYKMYVPEMIFGHLHAGSNFNDDDRSGAGMNGLGAKLTNIFSTQFNITTNDTKNTFTQSFKDNMGVIGDPEVVKDPRSKGMTKITFAPDYQRLGCELNDDNIERIRKRVWDVAGCNPGIKVFWQGTQIKLKSFEDYVRMYADDIVVDHNSNWCVAVAPSTDDSFEHVSFVNGVDTFSGGTHINYVVENIIYKVRDHILKKHKIEIKPNNIKQQMRLFIKCTINAPTFPSQSKDQLSTPPSQYGVGWSPSAKFMTTLLSSSVVQSVLDWAEGEQRKAELAELRKLQDKAQKTNYLKNIVKFDDATTKDRKVARLFLTEGDSAAKPIISARDSTTQGVFPLRGKMLNVRDVPLKRIIDNEEIHHVCAIIGLHIGKPADIEKIRFGGGIVITADADDDGLHITGLFLNFVHEFWPELITSGLIYRLRTPIVVASKGKTTLEFLNSTDYDQWVASTNTSGWKIMYQKGLGGWTTADFKRFLHDQKYYQQFTADDVQDFKSLDLVFDKKRANDRKQWLGA